MSTTAQSEDKVRDVAYSLWLQEGRPDGRAEAHWLKARELLLSEFAGKALLTDDFAKPAGTVAAPPKTPARRVAAKPAAKSAPARRT